MQGVLNDSQDDSYRVLLQISQTDRSDYEEERPSVMKRVAGFIIFTEFCERLAYYGFAGSLVLLFQRQLHMSNESADIQYSAWSSSCYITPLLGGYLADTHLGRYKTILIFCILYLFGLLMVTAGVIPGAESQILIFIAMYIIAIAAGGIKPNVSTMGADQFNDNYAQDRKEKESFFNWFYWSINLGALLSYSVVSYICQFGISSLGGIQWGFFVGFSIPTLMMALAVTVFVAGSSRYLPSPPLGSSILTSTAKIFYESLWSNRKTPSKYLLDRATIDFGGTFENEQVNSVKLLVRITPFMLILIPYWMVYSQMSTGFQNQGCQMDLSMGGTLSIPVSALNMFDTLIILLLVPFFDKCVYPLLKRSGFELSLLQKIGAGFLVAMLAMVVAAGVETYRLSHAPPAGNYFDETARSNISPCQRLDDYNPYLFQQWVSGDHSSDNEKPAYCRQICDNYFHPSSNGNITTILATTTTSTTASVSSPSFSPWLADTMTTDNPNLWLLNMTCISCDDIPQTTPVSVFLQIPQYALIGTSEILAVISSLEFFYSQSPENMKSLCQSLNMLTDAIGTLLTIPLLKAVNAFPNFQWVPKNLDTGHLDYYFYLLASIMAMNQLLFWWLSNSYVYKKPLAYKEEDEDEDVIINNNVFTGSRYPNDVNSSSSYNNEKEEEEEVELDGTILIANQKCKAILRPLLPSSSTSSSSLN